MAKYIIEIEDVPSMLEEGHAFFKCLNVPWWYISDNSINRLKRYEDDKKADIEVAKREAYGRGYEQGKIQGEVDKREARKKVGLECLRCKQTYDYSWDTMDEISYTMYSYCPDCIRKGIQLLKAQDKEGEQDG